MELKDFKNIHAGENIIVCSSGQSIKGLSSAEYDEIKSFITIGTSYVGAHFNPKYLICIDNEQSFIHCGYDFSPVKNTKAEFVFTQYDDLDVNAKKVLFKLGRRDGCNITDDTIDYSSTSTYMACLLAFHMGAKKIGLLGNDFIGHHQAANDIALTYLKNQFSDLMKKFKEKNVELVNLSEISLLNNVPYQALKDFENVFA